MGLSYRQSPVARLLLGVPAASLFVVAAWPSARALGATSVVYWGTGDNNGLLLPPPNLPELLSVSLGSNHAAAITASGEVICWGSNSAGQCNAYGGPTMPKKVVCAPLATLVLRGDGVVAAWGANTSAARPPSNLGLCVDIDAKNNYGAAVRATGEIWTWQQSPTTNGFGTGMRKVAAGGDFVLGIRHDGVVLGWGPGAAAHTIPAGLGNAAEIDAGQGHALARRVDGAVFCWSDGPCAVPAEATIGVAIAAGDGNCLVLRADGRVVSWGNTLAGSPMPPAPATVATVSAMASNDVGCLVVVDPMTAPMRWETSAGGNGHYYDVVVEAGLTWAAAKARAEALGGHLVSITSAAENEFVGRLYARQPGSQYSIAWPFGPFIGASQAAGASEPDGGWGWVTGEPWGFTSWAPSEPSNSMCVPSGPNVTESVAQFVGNGAVWNDVNPTPDSCFGWICTGFIVEWESDCNGDGAVDIGQILAGTLYDQNHNFIPDVCECPGDRNADRRVDGVDLAIILTNWGTSNPLADVDRDGVVTGSDLAVVLGGWGVCP